jgi:hypothetical protein
MHSPPWNRRLRRCSCLRGQSRQGSGMTDGPFSLDIAPQHNVTGAMLLLQEGPDDRIKATRHWGSIGANIYIHICISRPRMWVCYTQSCCSSSTFRIRSPFPLSISSCAHCGLLQTLEHVPSDLSPAMLTKSCPLHSRWSSGIGPAANGEIDSRRNAV